MRPHAQYLMVFAETKSATRTAEILGCSKHTVYRHLHRSGMSVRPYRRHPHLRLVGDGFAEWQEMRKREIDADLVLRRAENGRLHRQLAQVKGRTT